MKDKSLLESLPIELVQQVSSFLEYKSIVGSSKLLQLKHCYNNHTQRARVITR